MRKDHISNSKLLVTLKRRALLRSQRSYFIGRSTAVHRAFNNTRNNYHRSQFKSFLSHLPYFSPQYRLRARLQAKASRAMPTRTTFPKQAIYNKNRFLRILSVYRTRLNPVSAWNRRNAAFKRSAAVLYEEKFKRDLYKR